MTKTTIFGIRCEVEEASIRAEDMSISIFGVKDKEQTFSIANADLKKFSRFFEKYHCVSLGFSTFPDSPSVFNIDAIKFPERIRRLHFDLMTPTKVIYSGRGSPFENLQELSLTFSEFISKNFPDLHDMSRLRHLEVAYEKEFAHHWIDLKQIDDVSIDYYGEADLSPLEGLTNLKRLKLSQSTVKSLDGIECLPNLETLFIVSAPKLADVSALLKSRTLKNVMFRSHKKIKDWEFLKNKKDLRCISLDTAASIDFMRELPRLEFFFCSKVQDRNNKSFFFSAKSDDVVMTRDGIQVSYNARSDEFYRPLDSLNMKEKQ